MSRKKESPLDFDLHVACRKGDALTTQRILDSGRVHVDCQDREDGLTPLILSIIGRYRECTKILLNEGADPNLPKAHGVTPLMLAAQLGFREIVRCLLKFGARVDATNDDGGTALMFACQGGWDAIVEDLLERRCSIHKAMLDGTTALFLAAQSNRPSIVSRLIVECHERHRDVEIFVGASRKDGVGALFIAAQMGNAQCARVLLESGAEVDQSRIDNATPLFKACHKGHIEVVEELLKRNATAGMLPNGETCLHAAALSGVPAVVDALLSLGPHGVDPNALNGEGKTPIELAKSAGHEKIVEMLRSYSKFNDPPPIPKRSSLASSKSSCSVVTLPKQQQQQQQHVRFVIHETSPPPPPPPASAFDLPIQRIQCKLMSTEEMNDRSNRVRLSWKNGADSDQEFCPLSTSFL